MAFDLDQNRNRLIEERDRLSQEVENLKRLDQSISADSDNDMVEAAQHRALRDASMKIADMMSHRWQTVNAALQRIEDGTYGICIVCGNPIDPRRLDAEPATLTCIEHAPGKDFQAPQL